MRRGDPISAAAGVAAALALTGAAVAVTVMFRNRARALAESYRRAAGLHAEDGIVVVPGPAIEAYALPGLPGRIVVSGRLLDCLDERRRAALIAHEQAHLASRHHLFSDRGPPGRRGQPAPHPGGPRGGLHRGALGGRARRRGHQRPQAGGPDHRPGGPAGRDPPRGGSAGMALGVTGPRAPRVSLAWAGPVPRRVAALLTAPPRRQTILLAACTVIVLIAGVAALLAARDLHALLELAQGPGSR